MKRDSGETGGCKVNPVEGVGRVPAPASKLHWEFGRRKAQSRRQNASERSMVAEFRIGMGSVPCLENRCAHSGVGGQPRDVVFTVNCEAKGI